MENNLIVHNGEFFCVFRRGATRWQIAPLLITMSCSVYSGGEQQDGK